MRRNRRSTYLIIILICLIIFNLGSSLIQLRKNVLVDSSQGPILKSIAKEGWKALIGRLFKSSKRKRLAIQEQKRDEEDYNYDDMEDFIIIETLEEYEDFIKVKGKDGEYDLDDIPEPVNVKKTKFNKDKPYVFFYHTHSTEGYKPFDSNSYYTSNNEKNVVKVGDTITKVLEAREHNIIHNTTVHDRPSFNQSYTRSLNSVNKAKEEEENLKFFFDIHRDGIDEKNLSKKAYKQHMDKARVKINDREVATFFLVVGPNSPNYKENLNFAKYVKAVSDTIYPGLCKGIMVKPYGKFNLYVSDYAALFEVGSNLNTIDEANESAKLIGEVLDLVIRGLEE